MNYISPSHQSYFARVSGYLTESTSQIWDTHAPSMSHRSEQLTSC